MGIHYQNKRIVSWQSISGPVYVRVREIKVPWVLVPKKHTNPPAKHWGGSIQEVKKLGSDLRHRCLHCCFDLNEWFIRMISCSLVEGPVLIE